MSTAESGSTFPLPVNPVPFKIGGTGADIMKTFPHTKRVGHYLLGKTLGEGSFAKVKEALHTITGERVAIKVIDKKKARKDPYVRRNLRREGRLLQMVRHRNVVQLFEIMETENSYYIVTELCQGGDLMVRICKRRRLDEKESRRYIRQIVSALDHLHAHGVLHRDLKVENLLLDAKKDIKIIDFGLSNTTRKSGTGSGGFCSTQCGSPAYAAPELLGHHKYGPQVDVWSVGVNMYAMLTGNLPFTVEPFNIKSLHNKMLAGEMNELPDSLTKSCKDLVRRFLIADPSKRITLREVMRHPWIRDARHQNLEPAEVITDPVSSLTFTAELQADLVDFISKTLNSPRGEVIKSIRDNTANSTTATYHLLMRKLQKYNETKKHSIQLSNISRSSNNSVLTANSDAEKEKKIKSDRSFSNKIYPKSTSDRKSIKVTASIVNKTKAASTPSDQKTTTSTTTSAGVPVVASDGAPAPIGVLLSAPQKSPNLPTNSSSTHVVKGAGPVSVFSPTTGANLDKPTLPTSQPHIVKPLAPCDTKIIKSSDIFPKKPILEKKNTQQSLNTNLNISKENKNEIVVLNLSSNKENIKQDRISSHSKEAKIEPIEVEDNQLKPLNVASHINRRLIMDNSGYDKFARQSSTPCTTSTLTTTTRLLTSRRTLPSSLLNHSNLAVEKNGEPCRKIYDDSSISTGRLNIPSKPNLITLPDINNKAIVKD